MPRIATKLMEKLDDEYLHSTSYIYIDNTCINAKSSHLCLALLQIIGKTVAITKKSR